MSLDSDILSIVNQVRQDIKAGENIDIAEMIKSLSDNLAGEYKKDLLCGAMQFEDKLLEELAARDAENLTSRRADILESQIQEAGIP